jgi:multicomponent K+:H+ antiporter subunit F
MLHYAVIIAMTMFGIGITLNLYRIVIGPALPDRILALDTMYINAIALLVLYGIYEQSMAYFEVALLIAVMGFVGTVAMSKYLLRGDIIE